ASGEAEHRWVLNQPLCDVEGEIDLFAPRATARVIALKGRGFHDRWYGSGPIAPGVRRWVRGRAMCANRLIAFSQFDRGDMIVVEADGEQVRRIESPAAQSPSIG